MRTCIPSSSQAPNEKEPNHADCLVLTYGNRRNGNVEARLSKDDGKMWDAPLRLFQTSGDMGYPSTAQLPDGRMVTVFYAKQSRLHDGYHMGAIGWQAPQEKN